MPIEIIQRIQRERAEEAARQEAARQAAAEKVRLSQEEFERNLRVKEEKRRQFVALQTQKILKESGILDGLQRIGRELLEGNVACHQISYSPENGRITLAWGEGFKLSSSGEIVTPNSGGYDFSSIEVIVDPDKETLRIEGQFTYQSDQNNWRDGERVEKALAAAYIDPKRYSSPLPVVYTGASGLDDMGCCCCSGK